MTIRTITDRPENLDHALYCASCFAGNSPKDRTVTILISIQGEDEFYRIEDGRIVEPIVDEDLTWDPVYVIEAPLR